MAIRALRLCTVTDWPKWLFVTFKLATDAVHQRTRFYFCMRINEIFTLFEMAQA